MNTVLYLQSSIGEFNLRELAGVREVARRERWNLVIHPVGAALAERFAGLFFHRPESVRRLMALHAPDGVIVDGGALSLKINLSDFGRTPVVFLDRVSASGRGSPPCIRSDPRLIVETAFRELAGFGYRDYAFAPWLRPFDWSVQRGMVFAEMVESVAGRLHLLPTLPKSVSLSKFVRRIRAFAKALPKPVAILAVNDAVGECVMDALRIAGFRVPADAAVVSVDNNRDICEMTCPALSSVMLDFADAGRKAASTLAALMRGEKPSVPTFGAAGLVRRASTRRFRRRDARVTDAVEYIRKHVCEGIEVADVVGFMGVSRRLAELRFREVADNSILGVIREARRVRAEELLAHTDGSVAEIASACGYASASAFRKDFTALAGKSPRIWRQQVRLASDTRNLV